MAQRYRTGIAVVRHSLEMLTMCANIWSGHCRKTSHRYLTPSSDNDRAQYCLLQASIRFRQCTSWARTSRYLRTISKAFLYGCLLKTIMGTIAIVNLRNFPKKITSNFKGTTLGKKMRMRM